MSWKAISLDPLQDPEDDEEPRQLCEHFHIHHHQLLMWSFFIGIVLDTRIYQYIGKEGKIDQNSYI